MDKKKDSLIYPIVFMVVLTAVFVSVLALLNAKTLDRVKFNQKIELEKKILYVFDIDYDGENPENINNTFKKYISEEENEDGEIIYKAELDVKVLGYAFPVGGPGLWGSIDAYAGISEDFSTLLGIEFIEQSETPGLGGRIDEDAFKEQFRNLDLTKASSEPIVYRPAAGGNVDAIAGATLTSQAVADFLNKDLEKLRGGVK